MKNEQVDNIKIESQNKMATTPVGKLIWKMGLPMVVSMILQAVYNIVDTAFVINMGEMNVNGVLESGIAGNLALGYAFPIQILIIAIGVGTGVGINALISKSLGEGNSKKASKVAGNGIFLGLCIYVVFLLFGLFGSKWFISLQAGDNEQAVVMGSNYLKICCTLSFGSIGFTIYERFLQATGKTMHSTIAQISGAVANIVLDYVFIYPLQMGIEGAALATVIGQIISLIVAMLCHYSSNKEIKNHVKYLKPSFKIIKEIYHIGVSAALMQGLLAAMMFCVTLILGTAKSNVPLLQGSFGIYYKVMQFALFALFGLSNTIISVLSFNYSAKDRPRSIGCIKWGIIDSLILSLIITILFEALANPLATLFSLASGSDGEEIKRVVILAIRISAIGYVFMGFSIGVQGVLQAMRYALAPLLLSLLRLSIFVFPMMYAFTTLENSYELIWWTFPIAEFLTAVIAFIMLMHVYKKNVKNNELLV